jgi:hypothetical protein
MNMSTYTPDSWKLVKITSAEYGDVYKVLASWYGGFAGADRWKLSSGVESVSIDGDIITLPQSSGSTYVLHRGAEHMSGIMGGVYHSLREDAKDVAGFSLELITLQQLQEAFAK